MNIKLYIYNWLTKLKRSRLTEVILQISFSIASKLPVKQVIMFESFLGKQYSDNPRAIYEYLKEHRTPYKMYWSINKKDIKRFESFDIQCIPRLSIKWIIMMARSAYWVTNSRLPSWIPKPEHTTYVQTWHGTPLKRLAADMDEVQMPGTTTESYKRNFISEAKKWDYLISPNAYSTKIFKRAFEFEGKVIESGYPRNDYLVNFNNDDTILKIKSRLNIPKDKKIILYAPTWRDNQYHEQGKYKFNLHLNLNKMKQELGDNYLVILRLHYLVAERLDLKDYNGFVLDVSHYPDIRELYLVSDILVTDYSSVFFDYAILERPIIFYVYDIDEYKDTLRGFYFNIEEKAPGPLVKTTEDLIVEVNNINKHGYTASNMQKQFQQEFSYLEDGNSCDRVINEVFKDDF